MLRLELPFSVAILWVSLVGAIIFDSTDVSLVVDGYDEGEDDDIMCSPYPRQETKEYFLSITENLTFKLSCLQGYSTPLGGSDKWRCTDGFLRLKRKLDSYVPIACVEEKMPTSIYLDVTICATNKQFLGCHENADSVRMYEKEIKQQNLTYNFGNFTFELQPSLHDLTCDPMYYKNNTFWKVVTTFNLRLTLHKPEVKILPASLLPTARETLLRVAKLVMKNIMHKKLIANFDINENVQSFKAGPCPCTGCLVEKEDARNGFTTDIVLCRTCSRGWFLNIAEGKCQECPSGYYSENSGVTECTMCPSAHPNSTNGSFKLMFCYQDVKDRDRRKDVIPRGIVLFLTYNIFWFLLLIWNIRSYIRNVIDTKRASSVTS